MGGPEEVVRIARRAYDDRNPEYRWVVELLNHVIFAAGDPGFEITGDTLQSATGLQVQALTQLGYGTENGTWRNFFLTGAKELREGHAQRPVSHGAKDLVRSMTLENLVLDGHLLKRNFDEAVEAGAIQISGDRPDTPDVVLGYLTPGDPVFQIVAPRPVRPEDVAGR
ncbi:alkyl sulfatase dimerization domain-containing protein [Streptomyces sp. NPDC002537]